MQDTPKIPYSPPQTELAIRKRISAATYIFACAIWPVLGAFVWFGQSQMASIYEDFEIGLPRVTQLFLHPILPTVLGVISLAVAVLLFRASTSTQRQAVTTGSSFVGFTVIAIAVYAFFAPLVILVHALR